MAPGTQRPAWLTEGSTMRSDISSAHVKGAGAELAGHRGASLWSQKTLEATGSHFKIEEQEKMWDRKTSRISLKAFSTEISSHQK